MVTKATIAIIALSILCAAQDCAPLLFGYLWVDLALVVFSALACVYIYAHSSNKARTISRLGLRVSLIAFLIGVFVRTAIEALLFRHDLALTTPLFWDTAWYLPSIFGAFALGTVILGSRAESFQLQFRFSVVALTCWTLAVAANIWLSTIERF